MSMYAYVAGTTNDDINDKGSVACQIDFLKQMWIMMLTMLTHLLVCLELDFSFRNYLWL